MIDTDTVINIVSQIPLPAKRSTDIKKVFVLREDCPHCNELADSAQFKDFVKSNDFTQIVFSEQGYVFCADCKDSYIINRIFRVDTPTLVDMVNLDVEAVPQKFVEWLRHYQDIGIKMPKKVTRRKSESEETGKRKRKSKSEESEFVKQKRERKLVRRATELCTEDICIGDTIG